jgi:hypothetical protein
MKPISAIALSLYLSLVLALSACSLFPPRPDTLESMPLYAGAKEATDPTDVQHLAEFTQMFKLSPAASQVQNIQTKMYILGNGVTWDKAERFYSAELEKRG